MIPTKPSVLRRSYQRASITARAIFELSILAVWVHIVAIVYYRYLSATAPYYNFITNVGLLIAPAWFLISSYQLLGQTRETYEPSNCRRRFHRRVTGCNCGVKTYKLGESYNDEFESTYLSYYACRICLLVTSLYIARFWWISVRWLGITHYWSLNLAAPCRPWIQHPLRDSMSALYQCDQLDMVRDWSGLGILASGVCLGCYGRYT
ncbi:hypothetical protein DL98DRAFT_535985 [Cadophora sp. DSE1049]|nr:hypothetical protein DL98DRAFT_535985 [Cadophora sp. DSE1049]